MLKDIISQSLPGLEALLSALGLFVMAAARKWILAHVHNATEQGILVRLTDAVAVVVREAEQTMVAEMKKGSDKPLSSADAARVLDAVLANLKTHLGPDGIKRIEDVLKPGDLNQMLVGRIEAEVNDIRKTSGSSLASAVLAAPGVTS